MELILKNNNFFLIKDYVGSSVWKKVGKDPRWGERLEMVASRFDGEEEWRPARGCTFIHEAGFFLEGKKGKVVPFFI